MVARTLSASWNRIANERCRLWRMQLRRMLSFVRQERVGFCRCQWTVFLTAFWKTVTVSRFSNRVLKCSGTSLCNYRQNTLKPSRYSDEVTAVSQKRSPRSNLTKPTCWIGYVVGSKQKLSTRTWHSSVSTLMRCVAIQYWFSVRRFKILNVKHTMIREKIFFWIRLDLNGDCGRCALQRSLSIGCVSFTSCILWKRC